MNASFMVSILSGVTLAMTAALGVTSVLRRGRAASRHALLTAAFAVALILPAASAIAPYVTIRVPVPAPAVITNAVASVDHVPFNLADVDLAPAVSAPAVQRAGGVSLATVLASIWLVGFVVCFMPVAIGLAEIRSLGRRGLPWPYGRVLSDRLAMSLGVRRPVRVVVHASVSGPMTYGALRPTIALPLDAETWTDDQLTRAIVHELEHIRRADWLTQCLARTLCAAYWFHPFVWIARRRLVLEAERAADDAVLQYADASEYADQLVDLARRLLTGHQLFLAMASRHDLAARIRALLDGRQPRGRAGAWLVASISCVAAALVMLLSPVRVVAQPSSAPRPKFDVVSVRRCNPAGLPGPASGEGGGRGTGPQYSPGRLRMQCMTVDGLIKAAYLGPVGDGEGLLNYMPSIGDDNWLKKAPGWVNSDLYTVEGKTDDPAAKASNGRGRLERMLQVALEDRFHLKLHQETEDVPMYNLTVAKGGLKLKPMEPGGCTAPDTSQGTVAPRGVFITGEWSPAGKTPPCMIVLHTAGPDWALDAAGQKPGNLVGMLAKALNRHVFDKTGISDLYTFHLRFAHDGSTPGNLAPAMIESMFPPTDVPSGPSIFTVLEGVGLKLEPTRGPQGHFVIDHIERPSDN